MKVKDVTLPARPFLEHRGVRTYRTHKCEGPIACEFNWRAHQKFSVNAVGAEISFDIRERVFSLPKDIAVVLMAHGDAPVVSAAFQSCEKALLRHYIDECFAKGWAPWAYWQEVPECGPVAIDNTDSEGVYLCLSPLAWREVRRVGGMIRLAAEKSEQRDSVPWTSPTSVRFIPFRRLLFCGWERVRELGSVRAANVSEGAVCALLKAIEIRETQPA